MLSCKKIIVSTLTFMILLGVLLPGFETDAAEHNTGDIIEFGSYPQSKVYDTAITDSLNSMAGTWLSYYYYSGTGDDLDGNMYPSDYMRYCDVIYDNVKYRGVTFSQYRPLRTGLLPEADQSNQDENGYYTNTVYWFRFDPVKWRVLDPYNGLLMSEMILDAQAFNNYVYYAESIDITYGDSSHSFYSNNYERCSLREWLNNDFYNTAFSEAQKSEILSTELYNGSDASTNDKVYLLSYSDMVNSSYGFSSSSQSSATRQAKGTDYAFCQGLWADQDTNCSYWRIRTQGQKSYYTCDIRYDGCIYDDYRTFSPSGGVRPAIRLNSIDGFAAPASSFNSNDSTTGRDEYYENDTPSVSEAPAQKKSFLSIASTIIAILIAVLVLAIGVVLLFNRKSKPVNPVTRGSTDSYQGNVGPLYNPGAGPVINSPGGNFTNNSFNGANLFCPYCGKQLPPDTVFCEYCGKKIDQS